MCIRDRSNNNEQHDYFEAALEQKEKEVRNKKQKQQQKLAHFFGRNQTSMENLLGEFPSVGSSPSEPPKSKSKEKNGRRTKTPHSILQRHRRNHSDGEDNFFNASTIMKKHRKRRHKN
eukprot:TRINITY_DN18921_c0_g1_i1.p1 TRINITY_DN18921_c0_g1~~TRINITY_DN18921_c0_g1_i1.p1  ORF type:complete len:118 (-),score=24.16 TRINITY_DN18921_c0_g1_i1:4-357(-)